MMIRLISVSALLALMGVVACVADRSITYEVVRATIAYEPDQQESVSTNPSAPEHARPIARSPYDTVASPGDEPMVTAAAEPTRQPAPQLSVIVPPCIPFPGSHIDPCERRDTWPRLNPYVNFSYELTQPAPALVDGYLSFIDLEYYESAVQFVVRAIPIPGSTRCGTFGSFGTRFRITSGNRESALDRTHCWVDLAVNEYIVGSGPARLTIDIGVWIAGGDRDELANQARVFGERFEGWEWVITLKGPNDPNNASWKLLWHRDVQLLDDGTVVVVSWFKRDYLRNSLPEFRDINLERAEMTLTQYRNEARSAYEKYREATGGRIGAVNDINGNPLPFLADDASVESLLAYIGQIEVVEASEYTPKSPPPVPGENDPTPDGLRINDIIATRVAGGVAIPGGLEGTATPVSALGDEPISTSTVEATATATVEPTVTPEAAPTPEPEDTPTPEAEVARTPEAAPTPEPEPTATATPEPIVDPTDTPTPEPEPTATDTPEPVVEPTATATPEPAIEPTATPEGAVATDTPEPEVPAPDGPGAVGGPDGTDTGTGPDG